MSVMSVCCGTSVGVVARDEAGRVLMILRADGKGWAPPAGHALDEHGSYPEAAVNEVWEETGLNVVPGTLRLAASGWRPGRCGRDVPGPRGSGHEWRVSTAQVSGSFGLSVRETSGGGFLSPERLQELADATVAGRSGDVLEPVWVRWLSELGLVSIPGTGLSKIENRLFEEKGKTVFETLEFTPDDGPVQTITTVLDPDIRKVIKTVPEAVVTLTGTLDNGLTGTWIFRAGRLRILPRP